MKVARLSALHTGCLYPPRNSWYLFGRRLSRPQGHSAAGRIMSMKNSSVTIGNRNRDLQASSAVPQPTAPLRTPNRTRDLPAWSAVPQQTAPLRTPNHILCCYNKTLKWVYKHTEPGRTTRVCTHTHKCSKVREWRGCRMKGGGGRKRKSTGKEQRSFISSALLW